MFLGPFSVDVPPECRRRAILVRNRCRRQRFSKFGEHEGNRWEGKGPAALPWPLVSCLYAGGEESCRCAGCPASDTNRSSHRRAQARVRRPSAFPLPAADEARRGRVGRRQAQVGAGRRPVRPLEAARREPRHLRGPVAPQGLRRRRSASASSRSASRSRRSTPASRRARTATASGASAGSSRTTRRRGSSIASGSRSSRRTGTTASS